MSTSGRIIRDGLPPIEIGEIIPAAMLGCKEMRSTHPGSTDSLTSFPEQMKSLTKFEQSPEFKSLQRTDQLPIDVQTELNQLTIDSVDGKNPMMVINCRRCFVKNSPVGSDW